MPIPKSNARLLIPVALTVALVSNRLVNVLAPDDLVWRLHDATLGLCFALAALWALQLLPYDRLLEKCIAALVAGSAAGDVFCVALQVSGYWYILAIQAVTAIVFGLVYFIRSYEVSREPVRKDGHLYCLRTRPNSIQDLLIAMLGIYGPNGGYAIYCDGALYRYRRGIMTRAKVDPLPPYRYHVTRGAKATDQVKKELDALIGSPWTWRKNCLTVLGPIWRRHSGRPG
jgi:hypothetical protein